MKYTAFITYGFAAASLLTLGGILAASTPAAATPAAAASAGVASAGSPAELARSKEASPPSLGITTTEYDVSVPFTTLTGTATPNAFVGVTIAGRTYGARADADGSWTIYQVVGLVGPSTEGTIFETVDGATNRLGFTLTASTASTAPAAPVVTTTGYEPDVPFITISGTGAPDALIVLDFGGSSYGGRAEASGAWSIMNIIRPSTTGATGSVSQITTGGQVSAKASFTLTAQGSAPLAPATIMTTTYSRSAQFTAVSGTGAPDALIGLTVGGRSYDARVASDGSWTVPNVTTLVASSQIATVFQLKDGLASDSASFTLHADIPVSPVDVGSPADPAVGYQPNQPFTFTGEADSLADSITIRNFVGTLIATVPVDAKTGRWSWTRTNMGTSTWKLTFISDEGQPDEEKTTLADFKPATAAPVVTPIVFTNPTDPAIGYVANTAFTFRGLAAPGAKITLQNAQGVLFAGGITAAADGTWSWTRADMATSVWKITAIADAGSASEQKATLGAFAPQK